MELSLENRQLWDEKIVAYIRKLKEKTVHEATQGTILFEARLSSDLAPGDVNLSERDQVEAKLRSNLQEDLAESIRKNVHMVHVGENLLDDHDYLFPKKDRIHSLKVLEHLSEITGSSIIQVAGKEIVVAVYHICEASEDVGIDDEILQFATATAMPNQDIAKVFPGLIFGDGLRSSIVAWVINTIEYARIRKQAEVNDQIIEPLTRILLHGPPGTGKSSLALSVAHIVAVRHQAIGPTILLQVEAGHLINHMFGESSARIVKFFNGINAFCEEYPHCFVCIVIDEVEALGSDRKSSKGTECGTENSRVTSALLRGMDNLKQRANCFTICTTNLIERLDPAFVDRLGRRWKVDAPGLQPVYEILRSSLQAMMSEGAIPKEDIPEYIFAKCMAFDGEIHPGGLLYCTAYRLWRQYNSPFSARILRQLPAQAFVGRLTTSVSNLSHMMELLDNYVQKMCPASLKEDTQECNKDGKNLTTEELEDFIADLQSEDFQINGSEISTTASDSTLVGDCPSAQKEVGPPATGQSFQSVMISASPCLADIDNAVESAMVLD